jgi:hypothetical protein
MIAFSYPYKVFFGALSILVFPMGLSMFAFLLSYALPSLVFSLGLAFSFGVLYISMVGLANGFVLIFVRKCNLSS